MIILLQRLANLLDNPQSRGTFGEMIVKSIFDPRFFGDEEHYLVNDIILQTPDGKTHQIDHVVIYRTGVFCIETKNIEGSILEFLEYKYNVYSVIVFVKSNKPKDCGPEVLDLQELKGYVKNYKCEEELTSEQMKEIHKALTTYKEEAGFTKAEHISNIEKEKSK